MKKYWYDVLFSADARNNYRDVKEMASKITIEDILRAQKRTDTLFKMNLNIEKHNLNFLYK